MTSDYGRRREDRYPARIWIPLRRFFTVVGIVTLLGLGLLVSLAARGMSDGRTPLLLPDNIVLSLSLKPGLVETPGRPSFGQPLFKSAATLREMLDALNAGAKDKRVRGLAARLDGARFSLAQVQELRTAIHAFRKAGKFAWIYADGYGGASSGMGGYYLAAAFDRIWMQPVGSVSITGIAAEVPFGKDLLDKIGVNPQFSHKGAYKSFPESLTRNAMSDANREMTTALVADLARQVETGIAEDRGMKREELRAKIDAAPYDDAAALKEKLVDKIGYHDEMLAEAKKKAGAGDKGVVSLAAYDAARRDFGARLTDQPRGGEKKIALIYGVGEITAFAERGDGMAADKITAAFKAAQDDEDVAALVFRIDSPGGSPQAAETIRRAVARMREKGRPVIVSMGGSAASGGYWVAAGADKIVADPATLTGSIGVFGGKLDLSQLWQKIGVNWDSAVEGKNARMWSSNKPFTPEELARFDSLLGGIYDAFIARVAEGRKMSREKVLAVAEGRVWTGAQAVERGLVDELGGLDHALMLARQAAKLPGDAPVAEFPERKSGIERLADLVIGEEEVLSLPPLSTVAEEIVRAGEKAREDSLLRMPQIVIR